MPSANANSGQSSLIPEEMQATGRYLILAAAFLGWMFSGVQMALMNLAARSATEEFIVSRHIVPERAWIWENLWATNHSPAPVSPGATAQTPDAAGVKKLMGQRAPLWFAWYNSAFLFGAAFGGLVFGRVGDIAGRVKAMSISILCYSIFTAAAYWAASPEQLLALRFLAAMGVGGMWPAGVSLASEAWSDVSRPMLSGLIGTAANVGIVLMGFVGLAQDITADSWRWTMLVAAAPVVLGVFVWAGVPESPAWLRSRHEHLSTGKKQSQFEVFHPPLLRLTLLGIALGAIPLLGGWGTTAWLIPWADKVVGPAKPSVKAWTSIMRAGGGSIGSLLGGWIANLCGRRLTYFLISLTALGLSEYIYFNLNPKDASFPYMVFAVGFVSTIFFGWLPLYLPELFPTHVRATGSGVSFNFGRILTALGVLGTGWLTAQFNEDYGQAGKFTSLIYALGMIVILFAPDTTKKKANE